MPKNNESTLSRRSFIKLAGLSSTAVAASTAMNAPNLQAGTIGSKKTKGICALCLFCLRYVYE